MKIRNFKHSQGVIQKVVCCVCQEVIKEGDEPVSHGYCNKCKKSALDKIEEYFEQTGCAESCG